MAPIEYQVGSFPPRDLNWAALVSQVGPAHRAVGQFDVLLRTVPNPDLLLRPMRHREAVLSSRIEGTRTSLSELLEYEAEPRSGDTDDPRLADLLEVRNYRIALDRAVSLLSELPLCNRLIRAAHETLMQGVRGRDKDPGLFRRSQNWIGRPGSAIEDALFVPCPIEHLDRALARWESYLHEEEHDVLVQLALVHAEFEAIHPFLDGNGRIGRMILPLFLFTKGVIHSPYFYLSEFLESHRDEYYAGLLAVSSDGDWTGWCAFFLRAVTEQATRERERAEAILDLYEQLKDEIPEVTRSSYGVRALDWMFAQPRFRRTSFLEEAGIPESTARRILGSFVQHGILREVRPAAGQRSALFALTELIALSN